jgi:very-short-patch-repair endonuclease
MQAVVRISPMATSREDQLTRLTNLCQSELEREWLKLLEQLGLKLPSDAQTLLEQIGVRPDFLYRDEAVAIFIDGPVHDTAEQRARDEKQQDALEDVGLTVIRFHHAEDWHPVLLRYPTLFGTPTASAAPDPSETPPPLETDDGFDPEDFAPEWRESMTALSAFSGVTVQPGEEVMANGRVIDLDLATVRKGEQVIRLVDDAQPTADAVANALVDQGNQVLHVSSSQPDLIEQVISALTE